MKIKPDGWPEGDGLFETIRVEDGKVFALHRHHCRAKESAAILGIEIPSESEVALASYEEIAKHTFALGRLRWHFDFSGGFSLTYSEYTDATKPARLTIHDRRSADNSIRTKQYPYENLEWLAEVQSNGFDDAIVLTEDGQVSETLIATLLVKLNGEWITSPLSSGILNGVVRALVLEAGLAKVRRISSNELDKIESALLLTSLRNSQIVSEISGRQLQQDSEKSSQIIELMKKFKGL